MSQRTFADPEYESKKEGDTPGEVSVRMDWMIPWEQLETRIRLLSPRAGRGRTHGSHARARLRGRAHRVSHTFVWRGALEIVGPSEETERSSDLQ